MHGSAHREHNNRTAIKETIMDASDAKDPNPHSVGGSLDFTVKRALDGQLTTDATGADAMREVHSAAWCPRCNSFPCDCGDS